MMHTSAILLFALGAAAEVPHWVQKKPLSSFKVPSVESIMAPMLSMHGRQTPNNRRLQAAIMSEECKAACPGTEAYLKAMTEAATAATKDGGTRRLDAHMAQMKMMCEHIDAIKCVAANKVCQDEGAEQDAAGQAMLECMCACPKIMDIGEDMSKVCNDKPGTVGCIKSTSTCSAMAEQMNEKEVDLGCEYTSKKCADKEKAMATCMGEDDMKSWATEKCDAEPKDACCPLGKKMISCMGSDCYTIQLAVQSMQAEKEGATSGFCCHVIHHLVLCSSIQCEFKNEKEGATEEEKKEAKAEMEMTDKYRTKCPDAGIPSAAAVSATASEGKVSTTGDSADFATPGQTVSVLAMAAVIAASLMA